MLNNSGFTQMIGSPVRASSLPSSLAGNENSGASHRRRWARAYREPSRGEKAASHAGKNGGFHP